MEGVVLKGGVGVVEDNINGFIWRVIEDEKGETEERRERIT